MKHIVTITNILFSLCTFSFHTNLANLVKSNNFELKWREHLEFAVSNTPPVLQELTVKDMLVRLLPSHHHLFEISVDPTLGPPSKETFRIISPSSGNRSTVNVAGTTGVAAAIGVLHYLKYFCNSHISWEANNIQIPIPLPSALVKISSNDRFRYYQNVCTSSYSFVWWSWADWETHIDWMALNGINFPLAFTGQEAIWRNVYTKLNFTHEDLNAHFAGPSFLAWGRMGNVQAWGGPLSEKWHKRTLDLQKKIIRRMRDFGMVPILPAFAGHVPDAIIRLYPEAKVTRLRAWGHFSNGNLSRTLLLHQRDPLFNQIGTMFINEMIKEYNSTDHFYNCDPFNELTPPSSDPDYLKEVGASIFKAMTDIDPKAVWVMQGWLFKEKFWTANASKALLTSVPKGRMIILDLMAGTFPQYVRLKSFYGQPFIFSMLHNFGGINAMYGNVEIILKNLKNARTYPNTTLIGIGISPEGINQNYVVYDLMLEMAWRKPQLNYTSWASNYSLRRYGNLSPNRLSRAWRILMNAVYNCRSKTEYHGQYIPIARRPNMKLKSNLWYNFNDLLKVWDLFIKAARQGMNTNVLQSIIRNIFQINSLDANFILKINKSDVIPETFKHDLVDVTRQVLQVYGGVLTENIRKSYRNKSSQAIRKNGLQLLTLFEDMDKLLLTSKDFLLGKWLQDARECADNDSEKNQYVKNALHQLTLWGPNGEILDYAVKQWNGIVGKYMKPRWELFISKLESCVKHKIKFDQKTFDKEVFQKIERPFAMGTNETYPSETEGDPVEVAIKIYERYRGKMSDIHGKSRSILKKKWNNIYKVT